MSPDYPGKYQKLLARNIYFGIIATMLTGNLTRGGIVCGKKNSADRIVLTFLVIIGIIALGGNLITSDSSSGSSVPSESEVKEAAVNAIDNNSVPPVISETNTLYVKAGTSGHESFTAGEVRTIEHNIYWDVPGEVFGYFLVGYTKIEFDENICEPIGVTSGGLFSTSISDRGPGYAVVSLWYWFWDGNPINDPHRVAYSVTWRSKHAGTTALTYSITDSRGTTVRDYFLTGTVHNMQRVAVIVEFSAQPPAAPTNLVATATSSSQIDLTWQDNSDNEDGFKIERKIEWNGIYEEIATVNADITSYSETSLHYSTRYYYRIRAYNASGYSDYSNDAGAKTFAPTIAEIIDVLNHFYQQELIYSKGVYNSLYAKLISAQDSLEKGNLKSAINQLNAFCNEVLAQTGKQIESQAGDVLKDMASKTKEELETEKDKAEAKKRIEVEAEKAKKKIDQYKGLSDDEKERRKKKIDEIVQNAIATFDKYGTDKEHVQVIEDWAQAHVAQTIDGRDKCPAGWTCSVWPQGLPGALPNPNPTEPVEIPRAIWETGALRVVLDVSGPSGSERVYATSEGSSTGNTGSFPSTAVDTNDSDETFNGSFKADTTGGQPCDLIYVKFSVYETQYLWGIDELWPDKLQCELKILFHLSEKKY